MSYDLSVSLPAWPTDDAVVRVLADFGVTIVFEPSAPMAEHEGGWLPLSIALDAAAAARLGAPPNWRMPTEAGFELYVRADRASFASKSFAGTGPAQLVAMALARASGGTYRDPQIPLTLEVVSLEDAIEALRTASERIGWRFEDVASFPANAPPFEGFED